MVVEEQELREWHTRLKEKEEEVFGGYYCPIPIFYLMINY